MRKLIIPLSLLILVSACSDSVKESSSQVTEKKTRLEKLKKDKLKTEDEIAKLEAELAALDPSSVTSTKVKLVGISPVSKGSFEHYIDLQAKVDAENISYISPRGMGGQVKALYVKQGQQVRKGQLLLKLDDAIMQQQVVAARQQLNGIRTQLNYARSIYKKKKNLWDQGIGTEVQLITAKTNVESLENQLKAANEQVQVAVEQLKTTNVYADVSGVADVVNLRVGETFTGMTATGPQIKIVNTSNLKVVASVPENYISRIRTGSKVLAEIPDAGRKFNTTISLLSQSVDPTQRGFVAEAKIPSDAVLKPNQTAIMRILDYSKPEAVVISVNTVQTDESGKYVYVMVKENNNRVVARKKVVTIGEVYNGMVEIVNGLNGGELLITEGYQDLYDGQLVTDKVN